MDIAIAFIWGREGKRERNEFSGNKMDKDIYVN